VLLLCSATTNASFFEKREICNKQLLTNCLVDDSIRLFTEIPRDIFASALLPFSQERIGRTALDFGTTIALMPLDESVSPRIWDLSKWAKTTGLRPKQHQNWYIPGFLFYDSIMTYTLPTLFFSSALTNDRKLYRASYMGMKVWAYTIFTPIPFRYAIQRSYPNSRSGLINSPFGFHSSDDYDRNQSVLKGAGSFPSFRASMWIGLADIFSHEYGNSVAWYTAGTGFILLGEHKHWATDLFFGGLIGLSISKSVRTLYAGEKSDKEKPQLIPFLSSDSIGFKYHQLF